jgi:hypothetical protein
MRRMDNIEGQIEAILKSKGIRPSGMTEDEFEKAVFDRVYEEIPLAITSTIEKATNAVLEQEMRKVGRLVACRYAADRNRKKCPEERDCLSCPQYRPISRFRQNPFRYLFVAEIIVFFMSFSFLLSSILASELRFTSLITWYVIVLISRMQIIWQYTVMRSLGAWKIPQWLGYKITRVTRYFDGEEDNHGER